MPMDSIFGCNSYGMVEMMMCVLCGEEKEKKNTPQRNLEILAMTRDLKTVAQTRRTQAVTLSMIFKDDRTLRAEPSHLEPKS